MARGISHKCDGGHLGAGEAVPHVKQAIGNALLAKGWTDDNAQDHFLHGGPGGLDHRRRPGDPVHGGHGPAVPGRTISRPADDRRRERSRREETLDHA